MKKVFINFYRDPETSMEREGLLRFPSEKAAKEIGMLPGGLYDYVRTEERDADDDAYVVEDDE